MPEEDLAEMKKCQTTNKSEANDQITDRGVVDRRMGPKSHAPEINKHGKHRNLGTGLSGKEDLEESDKHHRRSDHLHGDAHLPIIVVIEVLFGRWGLSLHRFI